MSMETLLIIGGLIIIGAVVTVVVVMVTKKGSTTDSGKKDPNDKPKGTIRPKQPVFRENLPKNFSIGPIITTGEYQSSNLCDPTKLFPMKDVYVEYDKEGEIPDGSKCLEYLQAP